MYSVSKSEALGFPELLLVRPGIPQRKFFGGNWIRFIYRPAVSLSPSNSVRAFSVGGSDEDKIKIQQLKINMNSCEQRVLQNSTES